MISMCYTANGSLIFLLGSLSSNGFIAELHKGLAIAKQLSYASRQQLTQA